MYKFEEYALQLFERKFEFPFDSIFEITKKIYSSKGGFKSIRSSTCKSINWPKNPGVYVIRDICGDGDQVIYIGMTGKFETNGNFKGKQGLSHRKTRWNPYRFDDLENMFQYRPNYERFESKNSAPKEGYEKNIDIDQIEIDCFIFERNEKLAPTFLESLLLQSYLLQYEKLPPANNSF